MSRLGAVSIVALLLPGLAGAQEPDAYRLTIGDAARLAAERSTSVLEARARTEGAEARIRGTLSGLLPRVDVDALQSARTFNTASFGLDFPTIPGQPPFFDPDGEVLGPVRATDFRARATVPLFDWAAIARRRRAVAGADAAVQEERAVAEAAAAAAARSYVVALRARAQRSAREEDLALAEELLTVAEGQLDAGVGVLIDVTRAQAQVATIRAQLVSARHEAEISELVLRRGLHIPFTAALELADDLDEMDVEAPPTETEAVAVALERRGDLSTVQAYEAAAREAASATRAERLPTLNAYLDDGFYGGTADHLLNTYTWSFRVSVPVFDGLGRSSRLREEEARVREIGFRIDDMTEEVAFQVRRALLTMNGAQEQAAATAERLRLAELEVAQEDERLRAGVVGTEDVVRAAVRLNQARTARLDALAAVQAARVSLAAAMGTVAEMP